MNDPKHEILSLAKRALEFLRFAHRLRSDPGNFISITAKVDQAIRTLQTLTDLPALRDAAPPKTPRPDLEPAPPPKPQRQPQRQPRTPKPPVRGKKQLSQVRVERLAALGMTPLSDAPVKLPDRLA